MIVQIKKLMKLYLKQPKLYIVKNNNLKIIYKNW